MNLGIPFKEIKSGMVHSVSHSPPLAPAEVSSTLRRPQFTPEATPFEGTLRVAQENGTRPFWVS